jgi:23S rRNA pseudouridine2605 synthase
MSAPRAPRRDPRAGRAAERERGPARDASGGPGGQARAGASKTRAEGPARPSSKPTSERARPAAPERGAPANRRAAAGKGGQPAAKRAADASSDPASASGDRVQKILARAGITSRRAAEELILSGRVRVNGRVVTELGTRATTRDKVEVDGRRVVFEAPRYIVLHKPRGVVSTLADPEGRPTVGELFARVGTRVYPVGRLDFATSGVLLATNDGEFANGLLHPRKAVPKTYVMKVKGTMTEADVERWRKGVPLDDGPTMPAQARLIRHEDDKTWLEVTLYEGRNQQIRRMGEATGFPVMRLARVSFAGITHEDLRPGELRSLTVDELEHLRTEFGVPKRVRGADLGPIEAVPRPGRPGRGPRGSAGSTAEHGGPSPRARATSGERRGRDDGRAEPRAEARRGSGGAGRSGARESTGAAEDPRGRWDRAVTPGAPGRPASPARPAASPARPASPTAPGRSDRRGTTPRAAATPSSAARGPADPRGRRGRS